MEGNDGRTMDGVTRIERADEAGVSSLSGTRYTPKPA